MSNHFSAANLKSPGGDPRLDFTDLFAFEAPRDPGKTVLIADCCPFRDNQLFHPQAVYRINIDNDGDARRRRVHVHVLAPDNGQTVTATTPPEAGTRVGASVTSRRVNPGRAVVSAQPMQVGESRSSPECAVTRSSPTPRRPPRFKWTGKDAFAGKNVLSIALEVPNDMLASASNRAWGTSASTRTAASCRWTEAAIRRSTRSSILRHEGRVQRPAARRRCAELPRAMVEVP